MTQWPQEGAKGPKGPGDGKQSTGNRVCKATDAAKLGGCGPSGGQGRWLEPACDSLNQ